MVHPLQLPFMNKEQNRTSSFFGCSLLGTFLMLCLYVSSQAQTYTSRDNNTGLAIHKTSWEGGIFSVPANPTFSSGSVVVKGYLLHGISGNPDNATFTNPGTSLVVDDTFRIFGNFTMYNSASVHIKPGGVLIVHGNYLQDANVNFNNQGNAIFLGSWQSGSNPTSTFNTGNLYVAGTFTATGSSITSKNYTQLQTDNASLYAFSRNKPVAAACGNSNSGTITFNDPHISVTHWETSTDFFKNQITVVNNTGISLSYSNLAKTTSFRTYYKKAGGVNTYSDASTVVVRDIKKESVFSMVEGGTPENNLIASYSFDGNANDESGKGNNGTLHGGPGLVADRFKVAGKAYYFDGIDDYFSTTTLYPSPGPQLFSISIWFRTTTSTGGKLIGFGDKESGESAKRDRHLYMNNNGQIYFGTFPDRAIRTVNTTEMYNDGLWHHVVASLSPAGMELYVDGILKASNPNIVSAENYGGYWRIGYDALNTWPSEPASRYFKGNLDDIFLFEKRLSPKEIEMLYRAAPFCVGEPLNLTASSLPGAIYSWSGPNGFTSAVQSPVIPSVTTAHEGKYSVTISLDGCDFREVSGIKVTPPVQGGSIAASQNSVCRGTNSVNLTLENHVGNILQWESSTDNFSSVINLIAHTAAVLTVSDLSAKTSFRALVSNGRCGERRSSAVTIDIDSPPTGGSLSGDAMVCFGENSGTITLSGHTGNVVRWESSEDDFLTVEPIAHTAVSLNYTSLLKTTSYRAVIGSGACAPVYSSVAKISVKPPVLQGAGAIHVGNIPAGGYLAAFPMKGSGADVSGKNNQGGGVGPVPAPDRFGVEGEALMFDGVDDYMFTSTEYPAPGPNLFTISVWFNTTSTTGGRLVGFSETRKGASTVYDRHLYLNNNGQLFFGIFIEEFWPDSFKYLQTTESYNDGKWHHAVATLSPSGIKLYVDGELKQLNPNFTKAQNTKGYWKIGYDAIEQWPGTPSSGFYKGLMDEVIIFERELSPEEVKQLNKAGAESLCAGEDLALSAPSVTGATYSWVGPNNFTSADQSPVVAKVSQASAGTYTVVVSLDGCQAELSTVVNIIPTAVGGSLTASQTQVCSGLNAGTISLSGHSGTVVRWERSTDGFDKDFTPIAHTNTEYNYKDLVQNTSFRALISDGGTCADQYSSVITVTVDPATVGGQAVASATKVCEGNNSGTVSLGGQVGEVLRWESSTNNFSSDIVSIASTNLQIPFENLQQTTSFRAIVKSGACAEELSIAATVFVDAASVGGTLNGSAELCAGTNSGTLSLSGHLGEVIRWESAPDAAFSSITNEGVVATSPNELNYIQLNATTYYRAVVKSGECGEVVSSTAEIKVAAVNGGSLSGAKSVCAGSNDGAFQLEGYSGNVLRWESSTDNFSSEVTPISYTGTEFSFTNLSTTTSYRAIVGNGGICEEVASAVAKIVVEPAISGGNLTASQARVCSGNNTGTCNLTAHSGTVVRWESSTDGFASDVTPLTFTGTEYTFTNLLKTTGFRALVGNGGICADEYSSVVNITVDPASEGGTAAASATKVCEGNNSGTISVSGQVGEVLRWESSTNDFSSNVVTIASTELQIPFENLQQTTSFRAVTKSGACAEEPSIAVTVVVDVASVGGNISGSGEVCAGINSGIISLGGHKGKILRWESSSDSFEADIIVIDNTQTQLSFSNLSVSTSYRVVVEGGSCGEMVSSVAHISVSPTAEGGTVESNANSVCAGNNSGTLSLSTYQGNILRWESSTDDFQTVTVLNNSTALHSFQNLNQTTSFRAVIKSSEGCGEEVFSSVATVAVETQPEGGELSGGTTVCAGNNAGTLQLLNSWGPIIRWERSNDGFNNHVEALIGTANEFAYTNLTQTSSYRAVVGNPSCGEVYSTIVTVEVLAGPIGGVLAGSKRILPGNNAGTLVLEGYQGEILQWEVSNDNFSTDIRTIAHALDQLEYQNLEGNSWYRVQLGSAECAPAYSSTAVLTINRAPSAVGDEFRIPFGQAYNSEKSLLANDSDPDGDVLYIESVEAFITEKGNKVSIDAAGYFTFEPQQGFSGSDSFSYQVCDDMQDASICSIGMVLLEVDVDRKLIIYEGFSPNNGDDKNDKWVIQNIQHYPKNLVQVYNRYGVMVFEMRGYNNTDKVFEGFSNRGKDIGGKELPKDTYYYQIRLDEKGPGITGFVIINR